MRNAKTALWELGNCDVDKAVLGEHPSGLLTCTANGRMIAIISDYGRKPLSVADRVAAPADERAQAYSTLMAYAGRYTFIRWKLS